MKEELTRLSAETLNGRTLHLCVLPEDTIRDQRVRLLVDFMHGNLHLNISLGELANAVDLSTSHVSHLFNIETGHSPGEYLRRLRMEKARYLLATSFLRVKQIMATVSYDSKSHFARDFKRSFGLVPSEYRKAASSMIRRNEVSQNRKIG